MRFKEGDIIVCERFPDVKYRILKAYKKYYLWEYPYDDMPEGTENVFDSRNGGDPEFENWKLESEYDPELAAYFEMMRKEEKMRKRKKR